MNVKILREELQVCQKLKKKLHSDERYLCILQVFRRAEIDC